MERQFSNTYLPAMFGDEHGTAFDSDQAAAFFLDQSTQPLSHNQELVEQGRQGSFYSISHTPQSF